MMIVNNLVDFKTLPLNAGAQRTAIMEMNRTINTSAVLGDKVSRETMASYVSMTMQPNVNGAHGNPNVYISANGRTTPTQVAASSLAALRPRAKAGYFWMAYAREFAPPHASEVDGICTMAEFYVPGTNAKTRLLYEYLRGIFLWTIDHYDSYWLVDDAGTLVTDF